MTGRGAAFPRGSAERPEALSLVQDRNVELQEKCISLWMRTADEPLRDALQALKVRAGALVREISRLESPVGVTLSAIRLCLGIEDPEPSNEVRAKSAALQKEFAELAEQAREKS